MPLILTVLGALFRALPGAALCGIGALLLLGAYDPGRPTTLGHGVLGVVLLLGGLLLALAGLARANPNS